MVTKRKPNAKVGRPELDPVDDRDADLLADILVRISSKRTPDWKGEGWSSPPWSAIRREIEIRCGRPVSPSRLDKDDLVPGNGGGLVTVRGRMSALVKRVNKLEAAYLAFRRDRNDPQGRIFAMASIRRWLLRATPHIAAPALPDMKLVTSLALIANEALAFAAIHSDITGAQRLTKFIQQAHEQGGVAARRALAR